VGSDETGAAGDQDTFALRGRQELDRWEARESGVGDGVVVWMEYGLGLVRAISLGGFCFLFCRLLVILSGIAGAWGSQDIMRTKVKRSELIYRDFRIEAKTIEANGRDFLTRLV
jgi:hypothetical protein